MPPPLMVRQFRHGRDNLGYGISAGGLAMVVDGGAVSSIREWLAAAGLSLRFVTSTHGHADHTRGNRELLAGSGAEFLDWRNLRDGERIEFGDHVIVAYRTPGHTDDSICLHAGLQLLTGDTLFNGTVGNCFSGDLRGFFRSIERLMNLNPQTIIRAGHDYVLDSMAFAREVDPDNPEIAAFLRRYHPEEEVRSTLAEELRINPYLRFNSDAIIRLLERRGLPSDTPFQRWESFYSIG